MDVQVRGGYDTVTLTRQWGEMCRAQGVDPAGPAAPTGLGSTLLAAAVLRSHYERCLLDFEDYMLTGGFEADVQAGRIDLGAAAGKGEPRSYTSFSRAVAVPCCLSSPVRR